MSRPAIMGVWPYILLLATLIAFGAYADGPDHRRRWKALAASFPAPDPMSVRTRVAEYLAVPYSEDLRVRSASSAVSAFRRACERCFVALERGGIRLRDDRLEGCPDVLIPWSAIDTIEDGFTLSPGRYVRYPCCAVRLRDGGRLLLGNPAGADALVQLRMVRAHGPETPIIAAESERSAPALDRTAAAKLPALLQSGDLRWRHEELPQSTLNRLRWWLVLLLAAATLIYAGVRYAGWSRTLLILSAGLAVGCAVLAWWCRPRT